MDWDDLRFVLAVCRSGSALGAASALGVNQSTVVRRLAQLEAALGVALFERRQSGYVPTEHGRSAAATAERMEATVAELCGALAAARRSIAGTVRVTASEAMANRLVVPCLQAFRKAHPEVRVELITEDRRLNIGRGEADIALRAGPPPDGTGIVFRRMPSAAWTAYCSRAYAAEHGVPRSRQEVARHALLGLEGQLAQLPAQRWLEAAAPDAPVHLRSNSLMNLVSNLRAGLGIGMLPCVIGDLEPDLVRCFPPLPELDDGVWLILREDARGLPHMRAFADHLAAHLNEMRGLITGRAIPTGEASPD